MVSRLYYYERFIILTESGSMNLDCYLALGYYGSVIIKTKVCLIVPRICL